MPADYVRMVLVQSGNRKANMRSICRATGLVPALESERQHGDTVSEKTFVHSILGSDTIDPFSHLGDRRIVGC